MPKPKEVIVDVVEEFDEEKPRKKRLPPPHSRRRRRVLTSNRPKDMIERDRLKARKLKLLEALKEHLGVRSHACEAAGCTLEEFYTWLHNDHDFAKGVAIAEHHQFDMVQRKLLEHVLAGDKKSAQYYLSRKGRAHGYGDKVEISSDSDALTQEVKQGKQKAIQDEALMAALAAAKKVNPEFLSIAKNEDDGGEE